MSIAHVQTNGSARTGSSSSAYSVTYSSATTSGDLLTVCISGYGPATFTITDTYSNTWVLAKRVVNGSLSSEIWYAQNCTGGSSHQVTVTPSAAAYITVALSEFSGVAASGALDQTGSGTGTSTSPSSGNVTTAIAGELYIGHMMPLSNPTITDESGWNNRFTVAGSASSNGFSEETQGDTSTIAAGTYAATYTLSSSQSWGAVIATFLPASTAVRPKPPQVINPPLPQQAAA